MESSPAQAGDLPVPRGQVTEDIEMREAQLVFVQIESRWSDERQKSPKLRREFEKAEDRLMKLFMNDWAERPVMAPALSHYRRILLLSCGRKVRTWCRCNAHDARRAEDED
jgi:hypothetical protein